MQDPQGGAAALGQGWKAAAGADLDPATGFPKRVVHEVTGIVLLLVPAGEFQMGSPEAEQERDGDEIQHKRVIRRAFYLGETELTQGQWDKVMGSNPSELKGPDLPVHNVSWSQCHEFCTKAGGGLRLPTEAEWEFACRAGAATAYWFGDRPEQGQGAGNFFGPSTRIEHRISGVTWPIDDDHLMLAEVGRYRPNPLGLKDMHGNVWEWCEDAYASYPRAGTEEAVRGISSDRRVARGGCWYNGPRECRAANRYADEPSHSGSNLGLRVARSLPGLPLPTAITGNVDVPDPSAMPTARLQLRSGWRVHAGADIDPKSGLPARVVHEATGAVLLLIPAGQFMMGSPAKEPGRKNNENLHPRTIRKAFYLGRTEVTQEQWRRLMGTNPSKFQGNDRPVEGVSWDACKEFVRKAGGGVRLPSEAEWEYACRAGSSAAYSFGAMITPDQVNHDGTSSAASSRPNTFREQTVAAGSLPMNLWGLHEMHGNVWEWCEDGFDSYPASGTEVPAARSAIRVSRGGSWYNYSAPCRSANRMSFASYYSDDNLGLRLAASADAVASGVGSLGDGLAPTTRSPEDALEDFGEGWEAAPGSTLDDATGYPTRLLHSASGIVLVLLPAGEFRMGSETSEPSRDGDEPTHQREIRSPFYLAITEVTQAQWQLVMRTNPSEFRGAALPVEKVSWEDCKEFCRKAGGGLRLPSEAEWEYACRAGSTTPFSLGNDLEANVANFNGNYPYSGGRVGVYRARTVPAASLPSNPWGLHEMHGNVWEWCEDVPSNYPSLGTELPSMAAGASKRVMRGGSWYHHARHARSANRDIDKMSTANATVGFRVAKSLPTRGRTGSGSRSSRSGSASITGDLGVFEKALGDAWMPDAGAELDIESGLPNRIVHKSTGAVLLLLRPGTFTMGSPDGEHEREDDEVQHRRVIRGTFYLGETEVTQAQWENVMGSNPSGFTNPDHPVEMVSWADCRIFCTRAGGGLRLPSEAEWEYACRAGTTSPFSFGSSVSTQQVNFDGNYPYANSANGSFRETTVPVASLPANPWGFHEMHGNVWEWCQDQFGPYPVFGTEAPNSGTSNRVARGGSWFTVAGSTRSASRAEFKAEHRHQSVGFRLARSISP